MSKCSSSTTGVHPCFDAISATECWLSAFLPEAVNSKRGTTRSWQLFKCQRSRVSWRWREAYSNLEFVVRIWITASCCTSIPRKRKRKTATVGWSSVQLFLIHGEVVHFTPNSSALLHYNIEYITYAPINSRLNIVVRSSTPFGLSRKGYWSSRGSQLPRALPSRKAFFRRAAPWTTAQGQHAAFLKSVACFLSLVLLLLMSGTVHHNPGPIFPCSVCAGNVTWRARSVQCYIYSKWVHLKCSLFLDLKL